MRFDEHFISSALPDVSIINGTVPRDLRFAVDSRQLEKGDVFVAIEGALNDGHAYVQQAVSKGAAGLIIQSNKKSCLQTLDSSLRAGLWVIAVSDTTQALITLARAWREQFSIPIVAVTGSVGKTSTKELLGSMLQLGGHTVLLTQGNQNTRLGCALNVLRLTSQHTVGVFEMGINKRNEMKEIVSIVKPTTAVITHIGHSHMEGLGSLQDIALEKRDIFSCFGEKNIGVINGDQAFLSQVSYSHPVIKFGTKTTNQIQARKIKVTGSHISFVIKIYKNKYRVSLNSPHAGAVFNALAAAAVAYQLGVPDDLIIKAIQTPPVVSGRFEYCTMAQGGVLINDCYNANPESMKAALLALQNMDTPAKKIAILGDMLELGANSPFWHRQLGRFLRKVPSLDTVIFVGSMMEWAKKTAPVTLTIEMAHDWNDAAAKLAAHLSKHNSVVLVKGSNGMKLSNLVHKFTQSNSVA